MDSTLDSPSRVPPSVSGTVTGTTANERDGLAPFIPENLSSGSGRRLTCKENSLTHRWVFIHAAEGPSQPMLDLTSMHLAVIEQLLSAWFCTRHWGGKIQMNEHQACPSKAKDLWERLETNNSRYTSK